ncbi:Bardet-Biedl syndrome 1 protein [Orchesella cincta]|uniref:Bardet-Biedl syndrome 1 protein n=1 Tax=Orchesella cincta TaxID=48709 RepID=A0A1D2MS65_ORCCI|nr:Bardet-Biedl syndrome 1 protein [Orchesella cincta]
MERHEMWLDAFSDTQATIYTFPNCVATADLAGDGDYRLIIADIGTGTIPSKLKVYKGTGLQSEVTLQDIPTAVAPMFIDNDSPRLPVITVGTSEYIYVYKNLRPFFRAVLPPLQINSVERDIWGQYDSEETLFELLKNLRSQIGMSALTLKSQHLLTLPQHERHSFLEAHKGTPLVRKNIVTCLSTLRKSHNEDDALACLVIGTENCEIFAKLTLSDVPVFLSTAGLFDIDYTLTCTTRSGQLLIGRRGWVSPLLSLSKPPVGVVCLDTSIIVALMDATLNCYSDKGCRVWTVPVVSPITCLYRVHLRQRNLEMVAVGLHNGHVSLYTLSGECTDTIFFNEPISALYFGQYGRECSSMICVTQGGSLHVKILKRSADFTPELKEKGAGAMAKLQIPKKTKLFVDQTMRERENSIDAFRMKLATARTLVHVLNTKQSPIQESVKLSAEVLGLGPSFVVRIGVMNIGPKSGAGSTGISDLALFFHWNDKFYDVSPPIIHVPFLVPSVEVKFQAKVESINPNGLADVIRVIVLRKKQAQPILVAMINMPPSEIVF